MVEKVTNSSNNTYIKQRFAQMPDIEKGEAHVIKSGESLWNIAKAEVGKKAKNSVINDYMLKLAKVNGLDTEEKMNNIKANTTIYLPVAEKAKTKPVAAKPAATRPAAQQTTARPTANKPAATRPAAQQTTARPTANKPAATRPAAQQTTAKPTATKPVATKPQQKAVTTPKRKPSGDAEVSFADRAKTVMEDKSVTIENANLHLQSGDKMYHVMNVTPYKSGLAAGKHPVMSFMLSRSGNIKDISYEGYENVNPNGYDYNVNADGKIVQRSYTSLNEKQCGTVDKKELQALETKLKSLIK